MQTISKLSRLLVLLTVCFMTFVAQSCTNPDTAVELGSASGKLSSGQPPITAAVLNAILLEAAQQHFAYQGNDITFSNVDLVYQSNTSNTVQCNLVASGIEASTFAVKFVFNGTNYLGSISYSCTGNCACTMPMNSQGTPTSCGCGPGVLVGGCTYTVKTLQAPKGDL